MNPNAEEENLTRLIDGELSEEEAERLLAEHPEWLESRDFAADLGDQRRAGVSSEREMPHVDFFSHRIRRRIEGDIFSGDREPVEIQEPATEPQPFSWFQRLRWLSALGFVACFGALMAMVFKQPPGHHSEVVNTYTPDPNVSVTSNYHPEADATVIELTGAPAISPAATAMTDLDRERLGRVLFNLQSRELNRPVSVLSRDSSEDLPGAILIGF